MKILKFYSQSCAPCKMLTPILESIQQTYDVEVQSVDVEKEPRLAMTYAVRSVPTLVFEHGGNRVSTVIGMTNRKTILDSLGIKE
jgi:thioredoxin